MDNWGASALERWAADFATDLSLTDSGRHDVILKRVGSIRRVVNGGHLDEPIAFGRGLRIVKHFAPDKVGDFHRAWAYCARNAPSHPRERIESRLALRDAVQDWLDEVLPQVQQADEFGRSHAIEAIKVRAMLVAFGFAMVRAGKTSIELTDSGLGKELGISRSTVARYKHLWTSYLIRERKGSTRIDKKTGVITRVASKYCLRQVKIPDTRSLLELSAYTDSVSSFSSLQMTDHLHDPKATRWQKRATAWWLYVCLSDRRLTIAELKRETGLCRPTLTKELNKMIVAGEVRRESDVYVALECESIYDSFVVPEAA